jgi:hypothetical protein
MLLAAIAMKRKEQEDEIVRQLLKEEIKRKKFKEVSSNTIVINQHNLVFIGVARKGYAIKKI